MKEPKNATGERVIRKMAPDGSIEEFVEFEVSPVDGIRGEVRAEIFDDSGKTVCEEVGHNFISKIWTYTSRSWQRTAWSMFPLNEVSLGVDMPSSQGAGRIPWRTPNNWIAAWNSSSAEDSANEHMVITDGAGLIAYASRIPQGSPAGKRGVVNVTDSSWGENIEVMVFDWPTTAGNGTFQSIGWCDVSDTPTNYGVPALRPSLVQRLYYYTDNLASHLSAAHDFGSWGIDLSGNLVNVCSTLSGTSISCMKIPSADVGSGFTIDPFGGAERNYSPTVPWSNVSISGISSRPYAQFIGEYGGYYWVCSGGNNGHLFKVNKTTGALVGSLTVMGGTASGRASGTIMGSDAFVTHSSEGSKVWRYDLSSGTPSLTATINISWPGYMSANNGSYCLTNDGTDIYLSSTYGIFRIDTSGTVWGHTGASKLGSGRVSMTGSAPYTGTFYTLGNQFFEGISMSRTIAYSGTNAATMNTALADLSYKRSAPGTFPGSGISSNLSIPSILYMGGKLYGTCDPDSDDGVDNILCGYAELGWNMASRVLLGSAVTKTSSNTMKITYQTTLPSIV